MTEQTIKNIESKLNELAKEAKEYDGSVFNNRFIAYAQGIAFALDQIGYDIFWKDGESKIVKEGK